MRGYCQVKQNRADAFWCFVPVIVMTVALIVRTAYEDRLLRAELDGYEAYAARTGGFVRLTLCAAQCRGEFSSIPLSEASLSA